MLEQWIRTRGRAFWHFWLAAVLLLASGFAQAVPSACTAQWGVTGGTLQYWNSATGTWVNVMNTGSTAANAMGGFEGTGTLYYTSDQAPGTGTMQRVTFSNATGSVTVAQVSASPISVPANLTYTTTAGATATVATAGLLGATFDRDPANRRMFLYAVSNSATNVRIDGTSTTSGPIAAIGVLDPEAPTSVSWSVIYSNTGTTPSYPLIGTSGDIFADQQAGQIWIATNSNPNRMVQLSLNYSGYTLNSAQVVGTATISGLTGSIGAVALDPVDGSVYISSGNLARTWRLADHTANPVIPTQVATSGQRDAGNCVAPPDPPTVTKSFSPTTATAPGTTLLTITITNPNKVPLATTRPLTDTFPSGMSIYTVPSLQASCFSDGVATTPSRPASVTITGTAGATRAVIASGALIPGGATSGGSCSFSVAVSATLANLYDNTIPAGSLTTTAGSNAAAAASFLLSNVSLPNLPTVGKSFNPVSSTNTIGTTTLTIVITNPNTQTNTLTAAFRDVLPANMTYSTGLAPVVACFSNGVAVAKPAATTATVASGTLTIASGSAIPGGSTTGGSCSFSVRVTATVAAVYVNTIADGSLLTVAGANPDAASATFYLRVSDFNVAKSQRLGTGGVITTALLNVSSGATISYIISIRNGSGVPGTRTFSDSIPALVTPVLSVTATPIGTVGCSTRTQVVGNQTVLSGTVTAADVGEGCDITVVARASTTAIVSTATNSVGIYTVTGALDSNTADNTASVQLAIKPAALLTISKTDGTTVVATLSTVSYTITVANLGPSAADDAVMTDEAATGLSCSTVTCSAAGGASCPSPVQLFVNAVQTTGVAIPSFPAGSTVTFVLTCGVTATGLP